MKTQNTLKTRAGCAQITVLIGAILCAMASTSRAGLVGPYAVDGNTLHLWHLDENNGTPPDAPTNGYCFDSVTNNPQTVPLTMTNTPGPVSEPGFNGYPPTSFLLMGQPAFKVSGYVDYSNALHGLGISSCLYAPWTNASGSTAAQPDPTYTNLNNYVNPTTGAFTFEVLLKPDFDPINPPTTMEIICGDSGFSKRAWQWRFNAGRIEFNDITGSNPHQVFATLPTSGPDAAVQGNWYHVAVTFTGSSPTNGDTANVFRFYWTLLDPSRTNADVLWTTNLAANLHGSVFLTIGGNGRGSPVSSAAGLEGFLGSMDEARISAVCRKSTEMVFNTNQFLSPPIISIATTNYNIGFGQTLTIPATVFGEAPVTNQWYQDGVALPGQTDTALVISNVTFAANGTYQLMSTNALGNATSVVCRVTVGAAFQNLFDTGVDDNGTPVYDTAGGSHDLHWFLTSSPDPNAVVPYAVVLSVPLPTGPGYPVEGPFSSWIGSGNRPPTYPGTYTYQTSFEIDQGDPASSALSCKVQAYGPAAGAVMQTFLNGVETDIAMSAKPISLPTYFTLTNGLQAGTNTLVLSIPYTSGAPMAFRAELSGIGSALSPGLPVITNQPASQIAPYGTNVAMFAVALGRPPLSYQWLSNGVPVAGAIHSILNIDDTNFGPGQIVGTNYVANYQLVVSNDSGAVTSAVATLTVPIPPLTIVSAGIPIWVPTGNETNIAVIFSGAVDPVTAAAAANYSLDNGATVSSAKLTSPNEVLLTTSVLTPGTAYNLTVQNVMDPLGITMAPSPASLAVGTYPNVALWVRADAGVTTDGNGNVTQWNDLSTNGNNLYAPYGPPSDPVMATNNGVLAVRFAATNQTSLYANPSASLAITNDMSIFAVVNYATLVGNTNGMIVSKTTGNQANPYDYYTGFGAVRLLRGNGASSATVASSAQPSVGVTHLLDVTMQGTAVSHRLDGQPNGTGTMNINSTDNNSYLYLGTRADGGNRLSGDLYELIIIGSAMSPADVASMEQYIVAQYNLNLVNTSPTNIVFSASTGNLTLSWPLDHTGWTLQAQTNDLSVGLSTNWVDVPNSSATNQTTVPMDSTNGSVFYRLIYRP